MSVWFFLIVGSMVAFSIGSISFGQIFANAKGVNLKEHGSGGTGATNTSRVLGKKIGFLTGLLDVAKGLCAYGLGYLAIHKNLSISNPDFPLILAGIAVFGHCFSPLEGWNAGKGVATALGMCLAFSPLIAGVGLVIFGLTFLLTRMVSAASLISVAGAVLLVSVSHLGLPVIVFWSVGVLVYVRHGENLQRIYTGTERRIGEKNHG